jgi:large subunit ribosomal protein L28
MRVTTSALYAIDDKGGFDNYIERVSPEEMRSNTGEKLREVMHMLKTNPPLLNWGLSPKSFFRGRDRSDPMYTRFRNASYQRSSKQITTSNSYSPYFLPENDALFPERSRFQIANASSLHLWWKGGDVLEKHLKDRLGEAKSFEEAHPDHRNVDSFRKGHGAGGGGGQGSPRPRSKTYRSRQSRPF